MRAGHRPAGPSLMGARSEDATDLRPGAHIRRPAALAVRLARAHWRADWRHPGLCVRMLTLRASGAGALTCRLSGSPALSSRPDRGARSSHGAS